MSHVQLPSTFSFGAKCFGNPLTCYIGKLVFQGADVGDVNVEERPELGHCHADTGDGDVGQATAAVHWRRTGNRRIDAPFESVGHFYQNVSHLCSRPHPRAEERRWGSAFGGEPVSKGPWSVPQRSGWTGTCSLLDEWSVPNINTGRYYWNTWKEASSEKKKKTSTILLSKKCEDLSYLHLRVHAVVNRSSPCVGWECSYNILSTGGQ